MAYNKLKCYECVHLIDGFEDQGPVGGGVDNQVRCRMRSVIEQAVRLEVKYYGHNGSPFSNWLSGQTGIDENSIQGDSPIDDERVRVFIDEGGVEVAEFRDPCWISIDAYMAGLPRMEIKFDLGRLRDEDGSEVLHTSGKRFKKKLRPSYIRVGYDNEWLLRDEKAIVSDVLWRAMKGTCDFYVEEPPRIDPVFQSLNYFADVDEEIDIPAVSSAPHIQAPAISSFHTPLTFNPTIDKQAIDMWIADDEEIAQAFEMMSLDLSQSAVPDCL